MKISLEVKFRLVENMVCCLVVNEKLTCLILVVAVVLGQIQVLLIFEESVWIWVRLVEMGK